MRDDTFGADAFSSDSEDDDDVDDDVDNIPPKRPTPYPGNVTLGCRCVTIVIVIEPELKSSHS